MKRDRDEAAIAFFQLEEAVGILLGAVPSAVLLARLLQLCKRVRRQAWDFLTDPNKWDVAWLSSLCRELYLYREKRNQNTMAVLAMHPVFMETRNGYMLCRAMGDNTLLLATVYQGKRDDHRYPGWQICAAADMNTAFRWCFVARALALGWETRIVNYGRARWHADATSTCACPEHVKQRKNTPVEEVVVASQDNAAS